MLKSQTVEECCWWKFWVLNKMSKFKLMMCLLADEEFVKIIIFRCNNWHLISVDTFYLVGQFTLQTADFWVISRVGRQMICHGMFGRYANKFRLRQTWSVGRLHLKSAGRNGIWYAFPTLVLSLIHDGFFSFHFVKCILSQVLD